MNAFLAISKALSDENRVRALLAVAQGELCLCQVIELLKLSPATVSKHMLILQQAGLVTRRKQGRWHYYRLAGEDAPDMVREAIAWALRHLEHEQLAVTDAERLCCIRQIPIEELTGCYRSHATN